MCHVPLLNTPLRVNLLPALWPSTTYSSGQENRYFEWHDAQNDSANALALKLIERCPEIAEAGKGRDWEYAGWLVELMGLLERGGGLPVMFSEYDGPEEGVVGIFYYDGSNRPPSEFSLPPGGGPNGSK